MVAARVFGRPFRWFWAASAVSTFGTYFAFDAFSIIAILVLHAGPAKVSLLAATGLAAGAVLAIPLGPWVEFRRKRPVMIGMDLLRCGVLLSVPAAWALGWLSYSQLLIVSVLVAAGQIAFRAASGAWLKQSLPPADLLAANGRLEATTWTAIAFGPPLGGAAIGLFGPVITVLADAASYLLSAVGVAAIRTDEPRPERPNAPAFRPGDLIEGWRYLLNDPGLRPLFFNSVLVNGLIMATSPLVAVLMLGRLGFTPLQYGFAFGAPCAGGLFGAWLAQRWVGRVGEQKVLVISGVLRACWSFGLAFLRPGVPGLVLVLIVQFGLVTSVGVFNPVLGAWRLRHTASDRVARMLSAWKITSNLTIALLTAAWGALAALTSPRLAIAIAGLLMLATPLLLLRARLASHREPDPDLAASPLDLPSSR